MNQPNIQRDFEIYYLHQTFRFVVILLLVFFTFDDTNINEISHKILPIN